MKFKGTKVKWEARLKGQIASAVYCDNTQICMRARSTTEAKADMLLISKAPEMLDMLKRVYDSINMQSEIEYCSDTYYEIEQLIKEATEL